MAAIVVYGSLINKTQLEEQSALFVDACPVMVQGYRRIFNQEPSWREGDKKRRAALNVVQSDDECFNGVLVRLRDDSAFQDLDERERGYNRTALEPSRLTGFTENAISIHSESIFIYAGKPEKRNEDILPNRDYLELCLRGAKHWGGDFHEQFLLTTFVGRFTLQSFLKNDRP